MAEPTSAGRETLAVEAGAGGSLFREQSKRVSAQPKKTDLRIHVPPPPRSLATTSSTLTTPLQLSLPPPSLASPDPPLRPGPPRTPTPPPAPPPPMMLPFHSLLTSSSPVSLRPDWCADGRLAINSRSEKRNSEQCSDDAVEPFAGLTIPPATDGLEVEAEMPPA